MASFSGLAIALSFVFGCILLGLVAELYYLLWWKRRILRRQQEMGDNPQAKQALIFSLLPFLAKPISPNAPQTLETEDSEIGRRRPEEDPEHGGGGKDLLLRGHGEDGGADSEIMRLHNLRGPPRFLFTISEETKEELESEDGKSRSRKGSRARSLSDLVLSLDNTPFLSPLSSPPLKAPPVFDAYEFNPLFESSTEAEIFRLRSSPPPTFKFLRDAEEKLLRKLMEEIVKNGNKTESMSSPAATDERYGSFIRRVAGKSKEGEAHHHQLPHYHSTPSQVLPLASSPSTDRAH